MKQVLLAGSFGSYLSPASAIRIGLVPKVPVMRVVSAGNVAGEGAKMALLSLRERAGGLALLEEVRYVELSDRADFNDRFVEQLPVPRRVEIVACGALAGHVREIVARRGWPAAVTPLPAVLHNRPQKIVIEAERAVASALASGRTVALAYADCGTYGALDELCARYGVRRLPGLHCYDVFGGADRIAAMFDAEPGTYVLTDFLLRSFDRSVLAELGLDRYPELWDDYFGHYTRLVWLAQEPVAGAGSRGGPDSRDVRPAADPGRRRGVPAGASARQRWWRRYGQPARAAVRAAVRGDPGQGHRAGGGGLGARRDDRRGHRVAGQGAGADRRAGREAGRAGATGWCRTWPPVRWPAEAHLDEIVARLTASGVDDVFVPGGDATHPAGPFDGALPLLERLDEMGRPFGRVGITGYPESHPKIHDDITIQAMWDKRRYASYIVSNVTFDAAGLGRWIGRIRARGVTLPLQVGLAGPAERTRLLRMAAVAGASESARFITRHPGWILRFWVPGGYSPDRFLDRAAPAITAPGAGVAGLHLFTFNQLQPAEQWRRAALERTRIDQPRLAG